jgi:hypothetical protein
VQAAEQLTDPVLTAVALVLCSWSAVPADGRRALAMVERASALAVRPAVPARNLADSYRAFHPAMVRRYDEAVAQAEDVIGRAPLLTDHGYNTLVSIVALTACCAVHDPARVRGWVDHMLTRPSPAAPAWGVQGPYPRIVDTGWSITRRAAA